MSTSAATNGSGLAGVPADQYARASRAAEAVLYDGYLLRPASRRSAHNHRPRHVGVLTPQVWAQENLPLDTGVDGAVESWFARSEVVAECPSGTSLTVRLRFLQPQRRSVERYVAGTGFVPAQRLDVGGWHVTNADEVIPHERDVTVDVSALLREPVDVIVDAIGSTELEIVRDGSGAVRGRIRRSCRPVQVRLSLGAADAGLVVSMVRLRVVVENVTDGVDADLSSAIAAQQSVVSTHWFLGLSDGGFVSLLDPPLWAVDATAECANIHSFPVLAGEGGRDDLMLCAPVVLADYPRAEPRTLGDELDAAGAEPSAVPPALPAPITPATYPAGSLESSAPARWVVLRPAASAF
ncbi:MAG TPA: hypothetical protein VHV76_08115 [Mycobacteriales bacterium]|nr:hypothetical protein [Mycobacteriales bacterium]